MTQLKTASLIGLTILLASAAGAGTQSQIVTWVDAEGITHFGDPQFAPPEQHKAVSVNPTNAMVVPDAPAGKTATRRGGSVVTLERTKLKNKKGFRGYAARPRNAKGRRSRR